MASRSGLSSAAESEPDISAPPCGRDGLSIPRRAAERRSIALFFPLTDMAALMAVAIVTLAVVNFLYDNVLGIHYVVRDQGVAPRLGQLLVLNALGVFVFAMKGDYRRRLPLWIEAKHVFVVCGALLLLDAFLQYVTKSDQSRAWLLSGWLVAPIGLLAARAILRRMLDRMGLWRIPTVLLGGGAAAAATERAFTASRKLGYQIVARRDLSVIADDGPAARDALNALGDTLVVLAPEPDESDKAQRAAERLARAGARFAIVPPLGALPVLGLEAQHFFSHDVTLLLPRRNLERPAAQVIKRAFDLVVSAGLLAALSPVFAVLALAVRADGGPALFGQARIGRNGAQFRCLKFRSMAVDAEARLATLLDEDPAARSEWAETYKLKNDPRVTKLGRFLRKTSLDELPQLWNVFRGEMSLVGPRPIIAEELDRYYGEDANFYLRTRPGITGLWQISGRNDTTYDERVRLDAWYVKNWSLWYDIAILARTIPVIAGRGGAY